MYCPGTTIATNAQLYFFPKKAQSLPLDYFQMPMGMMNKVHVYYLFLILWRCNLFMINHVVFFLFVKVTRTVSIKSLADFNRVAIVGKDGRHLTIEFNDFGECKKVFDS